MIRVKFMAKGHYEQDCRVFRRQLPDVAAVWGNCEFLFDPNAKDYDWLVAYDDLAPVDGERFSNRVEELPCPADQTVFITMEPSTIKTYGYDFLNQFGVVLTSQEPWAITNPQTVYTQPALRWFYGVAETRLSNYDSLKKNAPLNKTGLFSTVCSSKRMPQTMHRLRYDFTQTLKARLPELEVFGYGVQPIDDKADALDSFRYHLTVENHIADHHWTEKLADAFLGATLPLYFGAPNYADYFPKEAVVPVPIDQTELAIEMIRDTIYGGEYEKRLDAILHARELVLDRYNLFAVLSREIEQRHGTSSPKESSKPALLYSRHRMRQRGFTYSLRYAMNVWQTRIQRRLHQRAA